MARTQIGRHVALGSYPSTPLSAGAAAISTFADGDQPNGNYFRSTGRELMLARNTGASARNITITAVASPATTITNYSLGAGEFAMFGPFPARGWRQPTGWIHVDVAHADVELVVVQLPSIS